MTSYSPAEWWDRLLRHVAACRLCRWLCPMESRRLCGRATRILADFMAADGRFWMGVDGVDL